MANVGVIRRRSLEQLHLLGDDEQDSRFACDCGQEYMTESYLGHHQQTGCRNRQVSCSFCNQRFASSDALKSHLMECGNKTEQCPNCRQYIRRSHFAYHYENNCAQIDKVETPPMRSRNPVNQRLPLNANKPVGRTDVPSDNSPMNSTRINGRVSMLPTTAQTSAVVECQYCHQKCAKNDWETHQANCLQNPNHTNRTPRDQLAPSKSNANEHFPCEICHQPIYVSDWSRHMQECREREQQRIEQRAQEISREPIIESFPCQYCKKSISADRFDEHQVNCQTRRVPVQYETIDFTRTRDANRPQNTGRFQPTNDSSRSPSAESNMRRSQHALRPTPNDIQSRDGSHDERRYNDNQPYPTNGIADDGLYPNRNSPSGRKTRPGHHSGEMINSSTTVPKQRKKKPSKWRQFCCGAQGED